MDRDTASKIQLQNSISAPSISAHCENDLDTFINAETRLSSDLPLYSLHMTGIKWCFQSLNSPIVSTSCLKRDEKLKRGLLGLSRDTQFRPQWRITLRSFPAFTLVVPPSDYIRNAFTVTANLHTQDNAENHWEEFMLKLCQ